MSLNVGFCASESGRQQVREKCEEKVRKRDKEEHTQREGEINCVCTATRKCERF